MASIKKITAREILDSRGVPTLEGKLVTDNGIKVYATVPSGESLGKNEGIELRDGDKERYNGKGVLKAMSYINNEIGPKLVGVDVTKREEIDAWLLKADGDKRYARLGVNTIMTVSQLVFKASAVEADLPLYEYINTEFNKKYNQKIQLTSIPTPIFNMINGGQHGTKNLEFQEFHIVPSTSTPFSRSLQFTLQIYEALKNLFAERNADVSVSEEGGFTPNLFTNTEALEIIREILLTRKITLGVDVFTGIDCAPAFFYKDGRYAIKDKASPLKREEYIEFIIDMVNKYNMLVLEDPLEEDDDEGWKQLTKEIGEQCFIVGDDFIAGDLKRVQKAVDEQLCNAILVKFNQVGTMTEMLDLINGVKVANFKLVMSQRLGETNDAMMADLAVGVQADFVKFGSPARGERIEKYNRLLNIEYKLSLKKQTEIAEQNQVIK